MKPLERIALAIALFLLALGPCGCKTTVEQASHVETQHNEDDDIKARLREMSRLAEEEHLSITLEPSQVVSTEAWDEQVFVDPPDAGAAAVGVQPRRQPRLVHHPAQRVENIGAAHLTDDKKSLDTSKKDEHTEEKKKAQDKVEGFSTGKTTKTAGPAVYLLWGLAAIAVVAAMLILRFFISPRPR